MRDEAETHFQSRIALIVLRNFDAAGINTSLRGTVVFLFR
jgi:hypothetical protein